jgi:transcription elongation factor GreA
MQTLKDVRAKIFKRKFYVTGAGLEKIKRDFQNLRAVKLAKTNGETPHLLHSDDLDPEYLDFLDDVTLLEAKLADLEYVIENYEIIKSPPKNERDAVHVGATILVDINGQENKFKILGTLEANPEAGVISNESPVGRALLGRKKGEEVIIPSPVKTHYKIKDIEYS